MSGNIVYFCTSDSYQMKGLKQISFRNLLLICGLLYLISLFINLGAPALFNEEPRRGLIALEMIYNGNFIVPTQMGEFYYKKPPVFNWVIILFTTILGNNEFAIRAVTSVSLAAMVFVIYWFVKQYLSQRVAAISALLFGVSGNVYFSLSLMAEIDIFYSLITFLTIILIYYFAEKEKYWQLFLITYVLGAIGFLTKGFPTPVFIAISLLTVFILNKNFLKLLSIQHFSGIALFTGILAGYFYLYHQYNPLPNYFDGMWQQSSDRAFWEHGIIRTILGFVNTPLINLKDMLPATLFLPFLLLRPARKELRNDKFLRYTLIIFLANIFIYWISPGTRSRYMMMLYPFPITLFAWSVIKHGVNRQWFRSLLAGFSGFLYIILFIAPIAGFFVPDLHIFPGSYIYCGLAVIISGMALVMFFMNKKHHHVLWFALTLILGRVFFDFFALPLRAQTGEHTQFKQDAETVVNMTKGEKVWFQREENDGSMSLGFVYYVESGKQAVLKKNLTRNCDDFFIVHQQEVNKGEIKIYHEFFWRTNSYYLVKFIDCAEKTDQQLSKPL